MRHVSNERRRKEKRGEGEGANYDPWLKTREVPSKGTKVKEIDYKTGRVVHLMSMMEMYFWHLFRWDDSVADIREQYPLENDLTRAIAEELRMIHPGGKDHVMTSTLYVTYIDGSKQAFSIMSRRDVLDDPRIVEKLFIEKIYWGLKGIEFTTLWGEDLNMIMVRNVMSAVHTYHLEDIADGKGIIRYMIAHKLIRVDMETDLIDYRMLEMVYRETEEYKCIKKKVEEQQNSQLTLRVNC